MYKFGKKAARFSSSLFSFGSVFNASAFPAIPKDAFGKRKELIKDWGMLANDKLSCCVFSEAAHSHMLFASEAGTTLKFTDQDVISDYSAVTGYNPANPKTDDGTDMGQAAEYRRKVGIVDANGVRHKDDAYVVVPPGTLELLDIGIYYFGSVSIGVNLEKYHMDQLEHGEPWDVDAWHEMFPGSQEGHCIPLIDKTSSGNYVCVTWGKEQEITPRFLTAKNDEGFIFFSVDRLKNNLSPEQVNIDDLKARLSKLSG